MDNPGLVSLDYLRRLDAEAPGRWIAQPKMDGFRRVAILNKGVWTWHSKRGGTGSTHKMPRELQAELESFPWPDGIGLDIEWMGPRNVLGAKFEPYLYVFDCLMMDGTLCTWPAWKRSNLVQSWGSFNTRPHLRFAPAWQNPGLVDRYTEQLQDPLSEGLVVRRADTTHIAQPLECTTHPHVFKVKYRDVRTLKG